MKTAKKLGQSIERVEDSALLSGRGRFADDSLADARCAHAAILRSPYGHARITRINSDTARARNDVFAVITGEQIAEHSRPFVVGVKQPMNHYSLAVDRVRYVGEPVAIVLATDRYCAEDAMADIEVEYEPLQAVVDAVEASKDTAPILHEAVGSNVVSERNFTFGEPARAFAQAKHQIALDLTYPRNICTPIECFVVQTNYLPDQKQFDVYANFMGPMTMHTVMALALGISGNKLRLHTPVDAGGSFGVKHAVFPYVVALAIASKLCGRPVRWVEDRLEHLSAATSATNRVSRIEAAVDSDGKVQAIRLQQLDDCGAWLRAPEPATLYRTHGHVTGAYEIADVTIHNRVVLTNKTPSGLNRGFGGPQLYFSLERLMQHIAATLKLQASEVIKRNLIKSDAFPYRTASGSLYDSGDYQAAVSLALEHPRYARMLERQDEVRSEGGVYGIGYAAVVEPSISNMGYITTVQTAEQRQRAGPKDGASATATISIDPLGTINVHFASVPQGQGHRTVAAQVVADVLAVPIDEVCVNTEFDSQKDAWSIAAGNYASRFSGAVTGALHLAATRLRDRIARIAAQKFNSDIDKIEFDDGHVFVRGEPQERTPLRAITGVSHWSPSSLPEGEQPGLRETVYWSMPQLSPPNDDDQVNSSGAYGFIFDVCGLRVYPATGRVEIDDYITVHDAGRILHPAMVDGQVRGGFSNAVGASLYEELRYSEHGDFLTGTLADYPIPTACEIPDPLILHLESPSLFTPLGAKGVGEGNCMSTPVCIANAFADATGIDNIVLPLTPNRVFQLLNEHHWFAEPTS